MYHPIIAEAVRIEHEIREQQLREMHRYGSATRSHRFRTLMQKIVAGAATAKQSAAESAKAAAAEPARGVVADVAASMTAS